MTNWVHTTAPVVTTQSGTNWVVNVTAANLDPDTNLKDFVVLFGGVLQSNVNFNKTSQNSITYVGPPIPSTTVEVRRNTPIAPAKIITYGERIASDDWNREINRISRRAAEWVLYGVGSLGILPVPQDDAYSTLWSGDSQYPATRRRIYEKIENVISTQATTNTNLQNQINTLDSTKANIASPAFSGVPTAPNPTTNTNTNQIQTAAGVRNFLLDANEAKTINNLSTVTQPINTNSTLAATTAFAHAASVCKRITVSRRATLFAGADTTAYDTIHSVNITPRTANSSFLVIATCNAVYTIVSNATHCHRVRVGSTVLASGFEYSAVAYLITKPSLVGVYTPGTGSQFTVIWEARAAVNGAGIYFGDHTPHTDDPSTTYPTLTVIEFENTI
jgi:hypothetical protein